MLFTCELTLQFPAMGGIKHSVFCTRYKSMGRKRWACKQKDLGSIPHFGSPLSSKVVVLDSSCLIVTQQQQ